MKKLLTLAVLACVFAYFTPAVNAAPVNGHHKAKHHKHTHHKHAHKHHHKSKV